MSDFLGRISHFSAKRLALLADELNDRVQALEYAQHEPIAIVGIGCRFPGDADTPEKYWKLLRDGVDAVTEVPGDRWDIDALYDPDPEAPGKMSTRWGGFIGPVDGFDAHFFGISPREAQSMDPQQRLVLETAWRALEHAGISPPRLEGSRTAVYLGLSAGDYYQLLREAGSRGFDAYTASGTAHSIASGRLSYVLGLRGASVSIDTACSSSMVAIHHAVQSLRQGDCNLALAGGVNLILGPDVTIALSKSHMMAPDGRCKAFDARADGFVRGEGCGILVLKRVSDAQADGDRIIALIRGSAANQDGRSNGLTAPSGPAQEAVLRDALADARCEPGDIGFVEAHGTGTSLGDPIELQALQAVIGSHRPGESPLLVGSVKAGIGHLEAAAGVAGVIKVALALQHRAIPGQVNLQQLNPFIPWSEMGIEVPRQLTPWAAAANGPRLAGVSSFGFSGTNVHLVLQEAPQRAPAGSDPDRHESPTKPVVLPRITRLLPVSARNPEALRGLCSTLAETLGTSAAALDDIAHTLGAGRAHFAHRVVVSAATTIEAAERLTAFARGDASTGVVPGVAGVRPPRIGFLFTGQGSQYAGMAAGLYRGEPVFREAIDRCDELLRGQLARPLLSVLHPEAGMDSPIDDTAFTQPALFAVEYALAQTWLGWGVQPAMLMGHSVGEFVAACVAGVFSLEDGLRLIEARGRLMGALPRDGAMAAVMAGEAEVSQLIRDGRDDLGIAAVNGPQNVVISGRSLAVDAVLGRCAAAGIKATRLTVSHAFHSSLMAPMLDEFMRVADTVRYATPRIDLVSNVTGEPIGSRIATAAYWRDHVIAPVQFASAVRAMVDGGCQVFLEIGPQPVLLGMARESIDAEILTWLPSLRRGRDDLGQMQESLAKLYTQGVEVDWAGVDRGRDVRPVVLPGYPFQRERYWARNPEVPAAGPVASVVSMDAPLHPLLGWELAQSISDDRLFDTRLGPIRQPWLIDHRIHGALLLPSPVLMEMALAAAAVAWGDGGLCIDGFAMHQPLALDEHGLVQAQTVFSLLEDGSAAWRIVSRDSAEARWQVHASGRVARVAIEPPNVDIATLQAAATQPLDLEGYYDWLRELDLDFGTCFRGSRQAWRRDGEVLARMEMPEALQAGDAGMQIHPALLDACLHLIGAALPGLGRDLGEAFLLIGIDRLELLRSPGRAFWNHIVISAADRADLGSREIFRADLRLIDDAGRECLRLRGVQLKRARPAALLPQRLSEKQRQMLHEIVWREAPLPGAHLDSAARIAARVAPGLDELARRHRLDDYAHFVPALDALAAAYVVQALRQLGFGFSVGESMDTEVLRGRLGVLERHRRLFARMLAMLAEDGLLRRQGNGWQVVAAPPSVDTDDLYHKLLAAHADCEAELRLTRRCAESLAPVLRGAMDPLPLLFPEGSLAETEQLYQNSPPARTYNGLIAAAIDAMLAAWPADRRLRVLEIGAGTGSTTAYLLPRLRQLPAGNVDYCFTDVSPLFLNRARDKFPDIGFLRTQLLDIGADPAEQGFEAGSFDIVLGANVLHATPDLGVTLSHVRDLLAPGGRLVLLEGATPQRFGDLTVGLLEGWWCYRDTQRRDYALMPRDAWLGLFRQLGFADARALPAGNAGPVLRQQAVYLADAPQVVVPRDVAHWLIVPDRQGLAQALIAELQGRGDHAELLVASDAAALATALRRPWSGIVHLAALDAVLDETTPSGTLWTLQQELLGGALQLVQKLASTASGKPPSLYFITRGAQATAAGESADPSQATLWGLAHGVAIEHPELACHRIDLDPRADAEHGAGMLADELQCTGSEDQLAHRDGRRLVRRLVHRVARPSTATAVPASIRADRSYLVTGGLRGLGLLVANWLVRQGVRHLALLGRQAADARARDAIAKFEATGVKVAVLLGDVSRQAEVDAALARIAADMPPLAGVVHSAGVLDDGVISAQTWARFATVMGPKVLGSWHLHRRTRDLEFFVLFSSGASLAGSPGQANHAAANAFEDALAWYRQARGLPTVSINWGPWAEVGAAVERAVDAIGLQLIAPADGLAALEFAMRSERAGGPFASTQLGVLHTDWTHLAEVAENGRLAPLFGELLAGVRRGTPTPLPGKSAAIEAPLASLRERIRAAMPNRRRALLREHVRQQTVKVLGLSQADALDIHEPLRQLGLDSLMAVELRNLLGKSVGRSLSATLTFDYPTVESLVEHLADTVLAEDIGIDAALEAPPDAATESEVDAPASFDGLSSDELAAQLASRLDRIASEENS
ncbi:MAG: SDR family NAD(P)-dependent oxidoreductase [Sinobacteraceae bacterium]|nr:SDR family NAD(P)-dependent oxidoreductase [Nevskiaceae bacterium]MCP5470746.1 SDR family NAD(P)-dependent oxidoreductase [Nevskiaceae bacterium]